MFADLWLILIPAGWTNKIKNDNEPELAFKSYFPSVYEHSLEVSKKQSKGKGLFNRDDQGDYWWELRHCAYYEKFEEPKIIYPEFSQSSSFLFDTKDFYVLDTGWIIYGQKLEFITCLLNSKLLWFWLLQTVANLSEQAFRIKKFYLENLPIKVPSKEEEKRIVELVDKIIQLKEPLNPLRGDFEEDNIEYPLSGDAVRLGLKDLEKEIDLMVYKLYDLTPEEAKIIDPTLTDSELALIGEKK